MRDLHVAVIGAGMAGIASVIPPGGFSENYETPLNVLSGQRYIICFSNWSSVTTVVPLVFGGTAVVSCRPLPVELRPFDAAVVGSDVEVRWATASEQNTNRFVVERSADESGWEEVAALPAAGQSAVLLHYRVLDEQPIDDRSYYRLRATDLEPVEGGTGAQCERPEHGSQQTQRSLLEHRSSGRGRVEGRSTIAEPPAKANSAYRARATRRQGRLPCRRARWRRPARACRPTRRSDPD